MNNNHPCDPSRRYERNLLVNLPRAQIRENNSKRELGRRSIPRLYPISPCELLLPSFLAAFQVSSTYPRRKMHRQSQPHWAYLGNQGVRIQVNKITRALLSCLCHLQINKQATCTTSIQSYTFKLERLTKKLNRPRREVGRQPPQTPPPL